MKFKVKERVILLNILPQEGDILSIKILRQLKEALSFSEDDQILLELKSDPMHGRITWDPKCSDLEKEVEVGVRGLEIIREAFIKLNSDKKLHVDMLELYEKFVEQANKL